MSEGPTLDALLPEDVARKAEALGVAKARRDLVSLLTLSVLAGAFIALGAMFLTVVATGLPDALPLGLSRVLSAIASLSASSWSSCAARSCSPATC
jgi:formate transporter